MKKTISKIALASVLFGGIPSYAVMEVHDSSVDLLIRQQIAADQARTSSLASMNWTMGANNAIFAQWGATQSMYEDFLNAHGFGGTKLGRYSSSVLSKCIEDKLGSWMGKLKIPSVMVCGTDIAADLANYLGNILNNKLNKLLKSMFGPKPKKKKSSGKPKPPGIPGVIKISDAQLGANLSGNDEIEITDENGKKQKVPTTKGGAKPDGTTTYKDSSYYITNGGLVNTSPGNTISAYMAKTTTGDKENLGDVDSPEIRSFYGQMAKQYAQVEKFHAEQFLRHSYSLKRANDLFNTTFVKNSDKNAPEQYTIDVPLPIAGVEKSPKVGSGNEGGCLLTPDDIEQKLGGCYGINFGMSFIPARSIVEDPGDTLDVYTKGLKDTGNKIIKKLAPKNGNKAAKNFINKFDIEQKIKELKKSKDYQESGINFATLSELLTSYADLSAKLINLKSPDGRDMVKINYLKAITYQLTILNEQLYLYNKINTGIRTDRYNELYFHVLNIEKELQKIRRYETFYLRKILLK